MKKISRSELEKLYTQLVSRAIEADSIGITGKAYGFRTSAEMLRIVLDRK